MRALVYRLISWMLKTNMFIEILSQSKRLTTLFTRVWLLSCMGTDVIFQSWSTMFSRVRTMRALVCSLISWMFNANMFIESPLRSIALPTFLAWVRFLTGVGTAVLLQIIRPFGWVRTVRALVWLAWTWLRTTVRFCSSVDFARTALWIQILFSDLYKNMKLQIKRAVYIVSHPKPI